MKTYIEEKMHSDTELTLGTNSILGIFFGLALICGVFFGFGYSLGRGNTKPVSAPQVVLQPPESDAEAPVKTLVDNSSSPTAALSGNPSPAGKPSGSILQAEAAAPTEAVSPESTEPPSAEPAQKAAALPPASAAPASSKVSSAPISAAIMVQIAAVSHREDANVLISALGKRGYNASVRGDSADNLLHVQVGPFATRDQAQAMRSRLLNDGYNAILK